MELHVLKHAGSQATPQTMVRSVKRADAIVARLIATETYLEGATVYHSPQYPLLGRANSAMDLRLPEGVSAASVLADLDAHFSEAGVTCQQYDCSDELNWPAEIAALLAGRGCKAVTRQVYQLMRYQPADVSAEVQVIPGRAAYAEVQKIHQARGKAQGMSEAAAKQHATAVIDHLDDARIEMFLARRQRVSLGAASLLTLGNVGVILDWFVLDDADDPISQTLTARVIEHCQRAQFEQVIIRFDHGDARAGRFEAMGFAAAATYETFVQQRV